MDKATFLIYMDEYLDGRLSGQELKVFTEMLEKNKDLSMELELHKILRAKIRRAARNEFREELRTLKKKELGASMVMFNMKSRAQFSAGINRSSSDAKKDEPVDLHKLPAADEMTDTHSNRSKRIWAAAIAAVFVVGISVIFLFRNEHSQTVNMLNKDSLEVARQEMASESLQVENSFDADKYQGNYKMRLKNMPASLFAGFADVRMPYDAEGGARAAARRMYVRVFNSTESICYLESDTLTIFYSAAGQRPIFWSDADFLLNEFALDIVPSRNSKISIPLVQ